MMLATRGRAEDIARLQIEGYLFDLKIDGVRAQADIVDGQVTLTSRRGVTCTFQYPEVVERLRGLFPTGRWTFDGEIAVNDDRGLPSWPLTHRRNAQVRNTSGWAAKLPATYYVFDVLEQNSINVTRWSLASRRQVLVEELPHTGTVRPVLHSTDGLALWDVVQQNRMEGMVAKRPGSAYRAGRSQDWVKIKRTQTVTCLVGGYDPGEGSRASTFGALHLYLIEGDVLKPVGKVGSGFSKTEIADVMQRLHQPPLIVEVEYLDVSPDGMLRQPVFQRLRTDARIADCTTAQLSDSEGSHA